MNLKPLKIAILGGGNVAMHLVRAVVASEHRLVQIYNRTIENISEKSSSTTSHIQEITQDADLYIVCVKDAAIKELADKIQLKNNALIVHTSGTVPKEVFQNCSKNIGVLYPFQTFSKQVEVDFKQVPIIIESSSEEGLQILNQFATSISNTVVEMPSEKRIHLHIAGVFVNNFTNFMFTQAYNYLEKQAISFDIVKPLIAQTVQKIQTENPALVQTGPAVRGDEETIKKHLELLQKHNVDTRALYEFITNQIIAYYDIK